MTGITNLIGTYDSGKTVIGYDKLNGADSLDKLTILEDVIGEWSAAWPKGQGFGSTDKTYLIKDYLDCVISYLSLEDKLETTFGPYLSITEKK